MSTNRRAVHVATITRHHKGKTYVSHLLRHTYREDGKVKHLTVGNLSDLPDDLIDVIRKRLAGGPQEPLPTENDDFEIVRNLPHGHVAAILGTLQKIGLDRLVASKPCREAKLVTAMIVLRIIAPGSKLANLISMQLETAQHSLADELQLHDIQTPELFDEHDLAEVTSADYPGERLIVCRNPLLAEERARKRQELLAAAEKKLDAVVKAVSRARQPLRGKDEIGLRVGRDLKNTKMKKHFELKIEDNSFSYRRLDEPIAREAALDGLYVVRTSLAGETFTAEQTVSAYKGLSQVEWAFRSLKTMDLQVRPIYHWKDDRIRAHVFLCMLAYYVQWHLRGALSELLFDDHEREAAEATRKSIVAPAPRSQAAKRKEQERRTPEGFPVQSFQCLLQDLATLCKNRVRWSSRSEVEFERVTIPTALQRHVFKLLGLAPVG